MASFHESNPSADKQRELDKETRGMVSALSSRLTNLHHLQKNGHSSGRVEDGEGDDGVSFITLAGNNIGASMRGDFDEKSGPDVENEALTTYVNSNLQTINNSIMLGGSYTANDPGVHLNISDYTEDDEAHLKEEKRGEMKLKASSKGHQELGHYE
ncbi:hypothetical protein LIER_02071 [Lithospermum erythrorhizon]|uniref:Uncharacterized protein n=1 Tax=Lithospermum erythrorhizon TaxID=34254 RepID=A0AAV3NRU6_LITER